jgi:hypothetical protein
MSAEDLVAREAERRGPSEWQLAEQRFAETWGHEADLYDQYDRQLLLGFLRDEVHRQMAADLARVVNRQTERLRAEIAEVEGEVAQ